MIILNYHYLIYVSRGGEHPYL
ncbi:hypothetical protein MEY_01631, partial [Candida albicans 19F]